MPTSHTTTNDDLRCSFCGKLRRQANHLIQGTEGVFICDDCIKACAKLLDQLPQINPPTQARAAQNEAQAQDALQNQPQAQNQALAPQAEPQTWEKSQPDAADAPLSYLPTPHEIYDELSQYVMGQEAAKRAMSVAVYNHYRRVLVNAGVQVVPDTSDLEDDAFAEAWPEAEIPARGQNQDIDSQEPLLAEEEDTDSLDQMSASEAALFELATNEEIELAKSNILLLGPTGTGKTLLAQTLARFLRVPFCIADATSLTEAGYVGEDVENILLKLIEAADGDVSRAEIGIVYVDEIDKVARKAENLSITRDVSGEGVQQALLKILEGTEASVPPQGGRKHPQQELIHIDTTNILFICAGAFVGLDKIVADRIGKKGLGFTSELGFKVDEDEDELMQAVTPTDLHKFGMIPEFVGRIPVICSTRELSEDDLVEILTQPKNAIVKQYQRMFAIEGVELEFEPSALKELAHQTLSKKTGARGLRASCEAALEQTMFDLPSEEGVAKIVVTKESILGQEPPRRIYFDDVKDEAE